MSDEQKSNPADEKVTKDENVANETKDDNAAKWEVIGKVGTALVTTIGVIMVAYFGYLGVVKPEPTPIPIPTQIPEPTSVSTSIPTSQSDQETKENETVLSIDDLQFTAFSWTHTEVENERGQTFLAVINDELGNKKYRLKYSLPLTSTQTSWGGLSFTFIESQDLSEYNFVKLDIELDSPEIVCSFDIRDISDGTNSVLIGLNRTYGSDIDLNEKGSNQIITIPINLYYNGIDKKAIKDLGCGVSTEITQGKHEFTINNIEFIK